MICKLASFATLLVMYSLQVMASDPPWQDAYGNLHKDYDSSSMPNKVYRDNTDYNERQPYQRSTSYSVANQEDNRPTGMQLTDLFHETRRVNLELLQQITGQRIALLIEAERVLDQLAGINMDLEMVDFTTYANYRESPFYSYGACLQYLLNRNEFAHDIITSVSAYNEQYIDNPERLGNRVMKKAFQFEDNVKTIFSWTHPYCMADLYQKIKSHGKGKSVRKYIQQEIAQAEAIAKRLE